MAKPKQNKIFYSDDESSEEEEGLVRCSSGYPRTKETGGEQHPILVQGPTEDRSFAANKAPESNRYKKNEATAPPKPRVGDPAAQRGTVNLEPDTSGEEVQDDSIDSDGDGPQASGSREDESNKAVILFRPKIGEPAVQRGIINFEVQDDSIGSDNEQTPTKKGTDSPAEKGCADKLPDGAAKISPRAAGDAECRHLVDASCVMARMTFLKLDELKKEVAFLSSELGRAKVTIGVMSLQISKMRARTARAPTIQHHPAGPVQPLAGAAHRATPTPWKEGRPKGYSCYLCNILVGDHSTDFCYKNPQRIILSSKSSARKTTKNTESHKNIF